MEAGIYENVRIFENKPEAEILKSI